MTFTAAQFDLETAARLDRIRANPNPSPARRPGWVKRSWTWGRTLNRAAALDSARNVFAVLGVGAVLAHLSVLSWPLAFLGGGLVSAVWYADYLRHF